MMLVCSESRSANADGICSDGSYACYNSVYCYNDEQWFAAAKNGDIATLEDGIRRAYDVNNEVDNREEFGWSSLHYASAFNKIFAVTLLLDNGTFINSGFDCTPLMLAVSRGHKDMVQYLIYRGSSVSIETEDGEIALSLSHSYPEIRSIILQQIKEENWARQKNCMLFLYQNGLQLLGSQSNRDNYCLAQGFYNDPKASVQVLQESSLSRLIVEWL